MNRLLQDLIYAPVGLVTGARELVPEMAERGRVQVANAKMMGEFAVRQGSSVMARQVDGIRSQLRDVLVDAGFTGPDGHSDGSVEAEDVVPSQRAAEQRSPEVEDAAPDAADLAIVDYESLAASQVVPRLATLDPEALEDVRRYEAATRARKTILGRIAQLQR